MIKTKLKFFVFLLSIFLTIEVYWILTNKANIVVIMQNDSNFDKKPIDVTILLNQREILKDKIPHTIYSPSCGAFEKIGRNKLEIINESYNKVYKYEFFTVLPVWIFIKQLSLDKVLIEKHYWPPVIQ